MRRALTILVSSVVVLAALAALVAVLTARDDGGLAGSPGESGPGELRPDRGAGHGADAPPARRLPTSGPHRPQDVERDAASIGGDALLHALEQGNVVLAYGDAEPPPQLRAVQEQVAGGFDPALAAAGQAVVLARVGGLDGVAALAWRRLLRTDDPGDPRLRDFTEAWLGTGAPR